MVSFDLHRAETCGFVNTGSTSIGLRAAFADNKLKLSIVGLPVLEDGKTVSMHSKKNQGTWEPPETVYERIRNALTGKKR